MTQSEHLIRKCSICDTVVEVLDECGPELICCGRQMRILSEHSTSPERDAHILLIEPGAGGTVVKVGVHGHDTSESHHIAWIEVLAGGKCLRQFLQAGDEPCVCFDIPAEQITSGRCYCNVHGLWRFTPKAMKQVGALVAQARP